MNYYKNTIYLYIFERKKFKFDILSEKYVYHKSGTGRSRSQRQRFVLKGPLRFLMKMKSTFCCCVVTDFFPWQRCQIIVCFAAYTFGISANSVYLKLRVGSKRFVELAVEIKSRVFVVRGISIKLRYR